INITSNTNQLNSMLVDIANTVGNNIPGVDLPVAITYSYTDPALGGLFCGGSITVSDSFINNYQTNGTLNGSMTLHNLCYSDVMFGTIIMNGTIRFSQTTSQTVIQYSNFSINDGSSIENINMTVTCGTSMTTCSISTDFEGSDGQVYRMADVGITTNFDDGSFNINATFYHPDHGSVNMIASRITLGCTNGHPDGGSIHITTEDLTNSSSATIVFRSDCTGYDGTYNDGAATGSISVDWPQ
ncbi:MAG: hypothetical protein OEZ38_12285, partial [Gammaproteobacteria bacterium]|nr:hypothetical protein [Gammaproteobacteria bacterium]